MADDEDNEWLALDASDIGRKIVEMADRVREIDPIVPGAAATWNFEIDDKKFHVAVTVAR